MDNENYIENIEGHWERMKKEIISNVSEKNVFKVDLLVESIENSLLVIKAELANDTDKPKQKASATAENNEEIDIERIKYRIKKCLLWLDAASDNIAALTYLYKFKEEDIVNEIMFLNFLKSQDIDFERGRGGFIFMDGYYASYIQFKFADVPVIKEKLNSFC